MAERMRVCLWATGFRGNIAALARYMSCSDMFNPIVVLDNVEAYKKEPIQKLLPVNCPIFEKEDTQTKRFLVAFRPHLTIVDNHIPPQRLSPKLVMLWHGYGWRGPQDRKEFSTLHKAIKQFSGIAGSQPNPSFKWFCAGPSEMHYRNRISGFSQKNLVETGQAFYDEICSSDLNKNNILSFYPSSFKTKKIVLLAFTWHYGPVFTHWGDDKVLFECLLEKLDELDCAIILRMHDRLRYEKSYLQELENISTRWPHLMIKFNDTNRDNLLDILISDIAISNYSSILTYFYATGKPTIHLYPGISSKNSYVLNHTLKKGRIKKKRIKIANHRWKIPLEDNGGLTCTNFKGLLHQLNFALNNPLSCYSASKKFIEDHMAPLDGEACNRITTAIHRLF